MNLNFHHRSATSALVTLLFSLFGLFFAPSWRAYGAETEQLKLARLNFDFGKYSIAIQLIDELHKKKSLSDGPEMVEAWRIHGLSHFYLGHKNEAQSSFLKLLSINPDYSMDPLVVPPAAVVEFDDVKKKNAEFLDPIRERKHAVDLQKYREDEARRKQADAEEAMRRESDALVFVQKIEKHHYLTDFLPFGAPQVEQNRMREGVILGVGQGLALAASIMTYSKTMSYVASDGKVPNGQINAAKNWRLANWISFGTAGGLYVIGVIDALWHHEDETVTWVPMPRTPKPREDKPKTGSDSGKRASGLFLFPSAGGAQVGFVSQF